MPNDPIIKRALISVSNKAGIIDFARALQQLNIKILSTGGTATLLQQNAIEVIEVADYTQFPEIMAGRVKTLHPKIHGALLGRSGIDEEVMAKADIIPIDLLVVNLYPFPETIAQANCDLATAIEQIDIGGPAMLRAAAKNYKRVTVLTDTEDYQPILQEIIQTKTTALATRFMLAQKVFAHTADYDAAISNYLNKIKPDGSQDKFPKIFTMQFVKKQDLRYGENPHQQAAFYTEAKPQQAGIATAIQHQGKALSFNNIADADAALECIKQFNQQPACVIVKHANPCGVAFGQTQVEAYERAFVTDPTSAFGGIIAFNQILEAETASRIIQKQFAEVIIAPDIDAKALAVLNEKPNIRVLRSGQWHEPLRDFDYKRVNGGLLVQDQDVVAMSIHDCKNVTKRSPTPSELKDLLFAWQVAKCVKSNAIVYAKDQMTIGIGAGQMSRVFSAIIASMKAEDVGLEVRGSVMASDAFFPFRDGIDAAAKVGITAIIQPGGSIRDEEVIAAANEASIAMVFTGIRHFKH